MLSLQLLHLLAQTRRRQCRRSAGERWLHHFGNALTGLINHGQPHPLAQMKLISSFAKPAMAPTTRFASLAMAVPWLLVCCASVRCTPEP